jgi:hypothetical protein
MTETGDQATPEQYLAAGWRAADGSLLAGLVGKHALATALRFQAAEVSPQQLATLRAAFDQVLPDVEGSGGQRMADALDAALDVAEELLGGELNEAIEDWAIECIEQVHSDDDAAGFLAHFDAVVRTYGALIAAHLANARGR